MSKDHRCNICGEIYQGLALDCACTNWGWGGPVLQARRTGPSRTVIFLLAFLGTLLCASLAYCQVTWSGPKQSPAELAAVLRACAACQSNVENWPEPLPEGPTVVIVGSQPGALGWLTFPRLGAGIRLDGSPAWWPPVQYGSPFWSTRSHFGALRGGEWTTHGPHVRPDPAVPVMAPRLR